MKAKSRAWILFPAAIVLIAVLGFVLSSRQEELGLMEPGKGMRAALAAAVDAETAAHGVGAQAYERYSRALLVAVIAHKNAASVNAADSRVSVSLAEVLDCLRAAREAWQAQLDGAWEPATYGSAGYWNGVHPALDISDAGGGPLAATEVRGMAVERAGELLRRALDLAD